LHQLSHQPTTFIGSKCAEVAKEGRPFPEIVHGSAQAIRAAIEVHNASLAETTGGLHDALVAKLAERPFSRCEWTVP
jgi:hypothetical protein